MAYDYSRLRATADRLLETYGQGAVLLRPGGIDESTYPVVHLDEQAIPCTVLVDNYSAAERSGTLISENDVKLLVKADVTPTGADRFYIKGVEHSVENVTEIAPGGPVLLFEVRARAG